MLTWCWGRTPKISSPSSSIPEWSTDMGVKVEIAQNKRKCQACLGSINKKEICLHYSGGFGRNSTSGNICMACIHEVSLYGKIKQERRADNIRNNHKQAHDK